MMVEEKMQKELEKATLTRPKGINDTIRFILFQAYNYVTLLYYSS